MVNSSAKNVPDLEAAERQRHHDRMIDYLKHLTTLSTGTIILEVAFLEKLFPHPKWKALVVISVASLGVSVVASVAAHTMVLVKSPRELEDREADITTTLIIIVWAGFLLGILSLAAFGLKNIFTL